VTDRSRQHATLRWVLHYRWNEPSIRHLTNSDNLARRLHGFAAPARRSGRPGRDGAHASARATTTIAARAYRVAAGHAARLSLALNAKGRRLLADFYQLPATLTLSGGTQLTRRVSLALTVIEASVADDWRWQCTPCSTRSVRLNLADLPSGTRIAVTCHGGGCPFTHRVTTANGAIQVGTMLRGTTLQPGATVEIELTKAGTVGQDLLYRMRSHDGAVLSRLCLPPGAARPVSCRAT